MKAGAAIADITPSRPLPLAGYTGRSAPAPRVVRPLEANVLTLEDEGQNLCLVALDGLFASRELENLIREKLERRTALVLVASHTHCAPSLDKRKPLLGVADDDHLRQVAEAVAKAVANARPRQNEVSMRYGVGKAEGSIDRRRRWITLSKGFPILGLRWVMAPNLNAPRHDVVQVLLIGDESSRPRAVIWSWPCHAVSAPDKGAVDPDFPGAVRQALRDHFSHPDLPVLYLPGFCGDLRPDVRGRRFSLGNMVRHAFLPITPFGPNTQLSFDALSESVGRELISAAESSRPISTDGLAVTSTQLDLSSSLRPPQPVVMDVHRIDAGDAKFMLAGAEVCSPYYDKLNFDPSRPMFLSGYVGPVFGYLPTERQRCQGGYEAAGFFPAFGLKGRFKSGIEAAFLAAVRRLGWPIDDYTAP